MTTTQTPTPEAPEGPDVPGVADALRRAVDALCSLQKPDGHFCGELEGDSILESEYILMKFILGQQRQPMADGRDGWQTLHSIAAYLRTVQRDDGGWGQYPGSGIDLSATVKAYYALKLLGDDPDARHMRQARARILELGGAERVNSFSNFYLACLGQVSYSAVPAIPPEIVLLPRWFYFHLTKVAAWTRTMILPLSLVVTLRPVRDTQRELGIDIDELYIDQKARHALSDTVEAPRGWRLFFRSVDRVLKMLHPLGGTPLRRIAIRQAEQWILDRAGQDGPAATAGLGAIFPPMVYQQIALQALGYPRHHRVIQRAEQELDAFFIEQRINSEPTIRIQPCFSPVWDTGIAMYALTDSGMTQQHAPVAQAADWLRAKQCDFVGDWAQNLQWNRPVACSTRNLQWNRPVACSTQNLQWNRPVACSTGGWFFEYANAWYPDVDDTAMVAMALQRAGGDENQAAAAAGTNWLLAMQNDDGGWAAFDRTTHRQILEYIPFADHNAMQDPSCPDITGRVLECLSWRGFTTADPVVQRALAYIRHEQQPEGCWFGRWGVNYIYGTWQAVIGPIRCGVSPDSDWVQRAGTWVKSIQKQDGSFGESANSYEDRSLMGRGPSTASQTAWAAMILQEIYGPDDPDLERAIHWLCTTQLGEQDAADPLRNPDGDPVGGWAEHWFTGTGFPKVFYLRYHLYRLYFPLMALGRYISAQQRGDEAVSICCTPAIKITPKV